MTILILILVKENDKLSKKKGKKWVLYFFHTQHAWASWCGLSLPSSQLLWPLPFVYHKTIQLIYAPPSLLPYPLRQRPSACPLPPKPGGTVPFWLNPCLTQTPPPPHITALITRAGAAWAEGMGALCSSSAQGVISQHLDSAATWVTLIIMRLRM